MWQPYRDDLDYYVGRADGLLAGARDGTPSALAVFAGRELSEASARRLVAEHHGCADWDALAARIGALADEPFARAYRALEAHDVDGVRAELAPHPEVALQEGTNGNDLLGMATATGDERTVDLLLAAGADPSHPNAHGWTPLHQAGYSDQPHLAARLLAAGADATRCGRGDGGTPLVAALFWGHHAVTDVLARAGTHPRNLRVAAGLGDLGLLESLLADPVAAGAHRGFTRPHSGFPPWTPGDDPQEILDEALSWAARSDRAAAVRRLLAAGARPDADVSRGTALAWAAATGAADAARALLAGGAAVDGRSSFGGPDHGRDVTPLHLAAQSGASAVIDVLIPAGADTSLVDGHGYGTAAGWAEHGGHPRLAARLRAV